MNQLPLALNHAIPGVAERLRDEALRVVSDNAQPWMARALELIPVIQNDHYTLTGEEIHLWIEERIGPPHHYNAWGALVNTARRRGLLEKNGQKEASKTPGRQAQVTPENSNVAS